MSPVIMVSWVAVMMLSLPIPVHLSCTTAPLNECKEVEFAPGSNLAGEGFDITKMQRKGAYVIDMGIWKRKDKTCTICSNPYLNKKEKLPVSIVDWRPLHQCNLKLSSSLHDSSESLVKSSSSSVENNWKASLDVNTKRAEGALMMAGTQSKLAQYSMEKTKKDRFSFTSHQVSCKYYSCRVSSKPRLHREFHQAVKNLPKKYNVETKPHYYKLIDTFGTHYITKVELGGSVSSVTSIRQCEAALQGLSTQEVKMCLDIEAAATLGQRVNAKTEYRHCKEDTDKLESHFSFSSKFNDRFTEIRGGQTTDPELLFSAKNDPAAYKEWMSSLASTPDLVSYSLDSLHELVSQTSPVAQNLRRAISHYILEQSLWRNCSEPCPWGVKTHPRDSCICSCHNNPGVTPNCCPTNKGTAQVKITVQKATGLWGDYDTGTDGYVKVFYLGILKGRTQMILNNNNPTWNYVINLGSVILSADSKVRFEVWDEDSKWDDDLLGACDIPVKAGVKTDLCSLNHGQLYYQIEAVCAPSLGGELCADYVGSPMSSHLQKTYVSRNTHPTPRDMLVKLGVLVDKHPTYFNRTKFYG